ncbi:capsular polysaccharide biosynthesis protein [Microbacterium sp. BK668]|nr:capsular polysaccharide biosynthesis protein [Microbacterium sp. BK668]
MLIAILLGGAAAFGVARTLPETYTATSTLLLKVESTQASLFERNEFSLARIKTYPALVDSPDVIDGVRDDLGLSEEEYSDRDIRRMLSADNALDTVLLTVRADAPTAAMAADMANSAARNLSRLIRTTENSRTDLRYDVSLDQVIPAVEPASPSSPQVLAITGLGLIAGFAAGAIVAVYRTTTNRHLRTISDVRRASGLPVVGRLPRRSRLPRAQQEAAEEAAFEDAVNNLFALAGTEVSRFVLIPVTTGSVEEQMLREFLVAFEAAGRRACVLDLRPDTKPGADVRSLTEVLDHVPTESHGVPTRRSPAVSTVYAMTSRIPTSTLEAEIPAAVVRLGLDFDIVLIVTPPTASKLIEATVATGAGVVLAIRHNVTSATDLVSIATRLRVMGVHPLGVLMAHAGPRDVGVAAESWRESDRIAIRSVEAAPEGPVALVLDEEAGGAPDVEGAAGPFPGDDTGAPAGSARADVPAEGDADPFPADTSDERDAEPAAVGAEATPAADRPATRSGKGRGTG